jgi:hypothetical protein
VPLPLYLRPHRCKQPVEHVSSWRWREVGHLHQSEVVVLEFAAMIAAVETHFGGIGPVWTPPTTCATMPVYLVESQSDLELTILGV